MDRLPLIIVLEKTHYNSAPYTYRQTDGEFKTLSALILTGSTVIETEQIFSEAAASHELDWTVIYSASQSNKITRKIAAERFWQNFYNTGRIQNPAQTTYMHPSKQYLTAFTYPNPVETSLQGDTLPVDETTLKTLTLQAAQNIPQNIHTIPKLWMKETVKTLTRLTNPATTSEQLYKTASKISHPVLTQFIKTHPNCLDETRVLIELSKTLTP